MWRHGERRMTLSQALEICEELGLDWPGVIARLQVEKESGKPEAERWRRYCARVSVAALVALAFGVTLSTSPTPAGAQDRVMTTQQFDSLHIMRTHAAVSM
jgi:hypothetical protein